MLDDGGDCDIFEIMFGGGNCDVSLFFLQCYVANILTQCGVVIRGPSTSLLYVQSNLDICSKNSRKWPSQMACCQGLTPSSSITTWQSGA